VRVAHVSAILLGGRIVGGLSHHSVDIGSRVSEGEKGRREYEYIDQAKFN